MDQAMLKAEEDSVTGRQGAVSNATEFGLRVLGGVGVGLLMAAGFPPIRLPVLLPIAIACLLLLLDRMTVKRAAYIGLACGLAFFGRALCWLQDMFGVAAVSLWTLCALFPAVFGALWVWLRTRLPRVPTWLLAGVLWTGIEVFRSEHMWPQFTWMGLGYAVVDSPWAVAPAALLGSYGLTFGVVALGALLADSVKRGIPNTRYMVAVLLVGWLILCFLPRSTPSPVRPLNVRLVQADSEDEESLFRLSHAASCAHSDVIVWPEYSFLTDPRDYRKLWSRLTRLAQQERSYLLFGAKDVLNLADRRAFRNTAYLLDPEGRLIGTHVKVHTVPFFNDGIAGRSAAALPTPLGRLGVATCFDLDFPDVARRLAEQDAEVFLAPSDNPREWGTLQHVQHIQLFQMRAVECGRWLATTDVAGNTFVVAPTGRVTRRVRTQDPAVIEARVGRLSGRTPFVRGGWLFGPACLTALCLLFACSLLPARLRFVCPNEFGGY